MRILIAEDDTALAGFVRKGGRGLGIWFADLKFASSLFEFLPQAYPLEFLPPSSPPHQTVGAWQELNTSSTLRSKPGTENGFDR